MFGTFLCTPSMKLHPHWCIFVLGTLPTPSNGCQGRNHTLVGVFLCSAPSYALQCMPSTKLHPRWCVFVLGTFPTPPMDAKHEITPSLVCFHVRHLFYALQCTPSMKLHLHWCVFVLSTFPTLQCAARGVYPPLFFFRMTKGPASSSNIYILLYTFLYLISYI